MDGVILVDKPAGVTSHDVVNAVRRRMGGRRTGHAGTLDPFATGLLLVLLGRATRVQRFLMALPKTYRAVARFGVVSSTGDPDGELTVTGRMPPEPLELPCGRVAQRPPAHSAVRVGGERAYRRARRGESFELPQREVIIHRFEQLWRESDRAGFEIECSSGTYVRSLMADLGDAYCEELRRTAIGPFPVEEAWSVPAGAVRGPVDHARTDAPGDAPPASATGVLAEIPVLGLERALAFLPSVELDGETARRAGHGQAILAPVDGPSASLGAAPAVLLIDAEGALAIAEPREGRAGPELKPSVVLRG
jgi:tRNA pseudouridine55 synthase